MHVNLVAFTAECTEVVAQCTGEDPPLVYKLKTTKMTSSEIIDTFLTEFVYPLQLNEPKEVELYQPDGTVVLRVLPDKLRRLPQEVLYDDIGLELFDKITQLKDEYYLTGCERDILLNQMSSITAHIPDTASVIELGCGSMTKTAIILDRIRSAGKKNISFYALDLDERYLISSLRELMDDEKSKDVPIENAMKYAGILGTYEEAISSILHKIKGPRVFLWLGSSIGNYSREESQRFMKRFEKVMNNDDLFILGLDKRNGPALVARAYNDAQGITKSFGLNGLRHINRLFGNQVFSIDDFEYFAGYNKEEGRHEAYFKSTKLQTIKIPQGHSNGNSQPTVVSLNKGELIRYEYSYKYSLNELQQLATMAGFCVQHVWTDSRKMYNLCALRKANNVAV